MRVRVAKFGGSIIGNGPRLARAADLVADEHATSVTVAVASAPGSLTDELVAIASQATSRPDPIEEARVLAAGEVLGATLLSAALRSRGLTVHLILPGQETWPIRLGLEPRDAVVDLPQTHLGFQRLVAGAAPGTIFVLPGFVGVDPAGRIGTMPRGGGDTTAVVAARALGLGEVLLVKDVPGILDADPRIVPEARPLPEVSVAEVALLAQAGAQVVAGDALRYVSPELSIRVVGLERDPAGGAGTLIRSDSDRDPAALLPKGAAEDARSWAVVTALAHRAAAPGSADAPRAAPAPPPSGGSLPPPSGWLWVTPLAAAPELVREVRRSGDVRSVTFRQLVGPIGEAPGARRASRGSRLDSTATAPEP